MKKSITWRAILIGLLIAVFVNIGSPYAESRGFRNFSWSYLPEGAVIPFLFVLVFNFFLRRFFPQHALRGSELMVIFIMALISNCTSIFLIYFFLSAIVSPHYFATPENRWEYFLLPYIPKWLIVQNDNHAVDWFYLRLPPGEFIHWRAWLIPLTYWLPFLFCILLLSYIIIVLFHKQWLEHEKLSYPLMQLPLALAAEPSSQ